MENRGCCGGKLKEDLSTFSDDVQKIFVDSSVAVIDCVRELVDDGIDDVKSVIDSARDKTKAAGDKAADYVRRNPWKAAAAFVIVGIAVSALASKKDKSQVVVE